LPFYIEEIKRGETRGLNSDGKLENNSTQIGKIQFIVNIKKTEEMKYEPTNPFREEGKEGS
jgi:hypothetical protein